MFRRFIPWSKGKRATHDAAEAWSLSTPLFSLSKRDDFTLGRALEGILILGATGSGKTTASGRKIALSLLRAGFGFLVLTGKGEERRLWEEYCRQTGRLDDLVIFGVKELHRFNFIDYELRQGTGAGCTENIVNVLSVLLEVAERNQGRGGGREDEGYWRRALRQLLRNLIDLLVLARGTLSIPDLYRLAVAVPTSLEQVRSDEWKRKSLCFQLLSEADKRTKTQQQQHDFEIVADYFLLELPNLSEKTRSVILSTFTSMIDVLNRGILRELFCQPSTITPEAVPEGKIVLIDLPVKEFAELGQFSQVLWKYCFMRSIERRDVAANPRPVCLWQDEGQLFTTSWDYQFQATCRASRVATVVLSQNISNFYAAMGGGEAGKAQVDSLFGNFCTKILHCNGDSCTNDWAAAMIGKSSQFLVNASSSFNGGIDTRALFTNVGIAGGSGGVSEQRLAEVEASHFTRLRTGGPPNDWKVDAIVFANGARFGASRRPWMRVTFDQRE